MNLRFLRAFASVAEHRNFSRAADALGVTQPAISRAVTMLERQLGLPLVERLSRGAELTEAGTSLYEHARVIFGAENAAIEQLALLRGLEAGSLRIGASTTIATYVLRATWPNSTALIRQWSSPSQAQTHTTSRRCW